MRARVASIITLALLLFTACTASAAFAAQARLVPATDLEDELRTKRKVEIRNVRVVGALRLPDSFDLVATDVVFEGAVVGEGDGTQSIVLKRVRFNDFVAFVGTNCGDDPPALPCSLDAFGQHVTFESLFMSDLGGTGSLRFVETDFHDTAAFVGGKQFICYRCTFSQAATFREMDVGGDLALRSSKFASDVQIRDNIFGALAIEDVGLDGVIDLSGTSADRLSYPCRRGQQVYLTWSQFGQQLRDAELDPSLGTPRLAAERARSELLCWRDNLNEVGRTEDALKAQAEAIRLDRDHVEAQWRIAWFTAWAREAVNGYGTDPLRPVIFAVFVVCFFGLVYRFLPFEASPDGTVPQEPLLLFALAYSLETFVPAFDVTGIKEWGWTLKGSYRWLEVVEAAAGVVISLIAAYNVVAYVF